MPSEFLEVWIKRIIVNLGKRILFILDNMDSIWAADDEDLENFIKNLSEIASLKILMTSRKEPKYIESSVHMISIH